MNDILSLSHAVWDCKYHLVWIPKYRKKAIYGDIRRYLGEVLRELALQKESKILEGHLRGDHIHMLVSIPPKYAVSQIAGYIKGKSAIHVARTAVIIGRTSQGRISEPGGILSRPLAQTRLRSDPTSPDKKKTIVGYPDLAPFFPSIGSKSAQKTPRRPVIRLVPRLQKTEGKRA
jgi:putative transposase